VCIALCTIVAHNIAQNRPDSFPPYPPDDHHSSDDVYLREGGGTSSSKKPAQINAQTHTTCLDYDTREQLQSTSASQHTSQLTPGGAIHVFTTN